MLASGKALITKLDHKTGIAKNTGKEYDFFSLVIADPETMGKVYTSCEKDVAEAIEDYTRDTVLPIPAILTYKITQDNQNWQQHVKVVSFIPDIIGTGKGDK